MLDRAARLRPLLAGWPSPQRVPPGPLVPVVPSGPVSAGCGDC